LTIVADVQRVSVRFSMSATHRPATVMRVVEEALQSSSLPDIARQPPPCCCISAFETQHIEYLVFMWVTAPGREPETVSAAFKRIYYALERAGAPVASVPTGLEISRAIKGTPARTPEEAVDMIRKIPIWSTLTENEMQTLAARLRCVVFGPGEPIVKEGETGASMFVLLRGRVTVTIGTSRGQEQIAMLDAGGFFGEMSLMTGERRSATVTAFDEVECVELHKDDVADLLQQRPELAHDISSVLENRQRELTSARAKFENAVQGPRSGALIARIQQFFGIDRKSAGAIAPQH
jgi:CRP-like cAMP-binding protein